LTRIWGMPYGALVTRDQEHKKGYTMKAKESDTTTTQPSTALALRSTAMPLPMHDMTDLYKAGDLLAQAGYLGTRNAGEGFLVMGACQQTGMSLIEFQQNYHLRQGRFSMAAHAMLAKLCERGGSYKILERTSVRAALELSKDGNVYVSEFTWEQAQDEPFIYAGKDEEQMAALEMPREKRKIKTKYKTPRSRMQMLWVRAVSDGVVVVDPGARGNIYTPEEVEDFAPERSTPAPITPDEAARRAKPVEATTFTAPDASVCPVLGTEYDGRPWSDIPTEALQNALAYDGPELRPAHKAAIRLVIEEREGVQS